MPYVRSFIDYRPPRRYDALPFTSALIKECATETGAYTTIETKTISPTDTDPSEPDSRSFTTALATLDPAWYKITWRDAALATFDSEAAFFGEVSTDLTSVDAVRAFLQKESGSDAQDSVIASLITRASKAITTWTRREFTPTTGATRTFSYFPNSRGFVDLDPYDLRTLTSIEIDSNTTGTVLDATQYRLAPATKPEGVWTSVYVDWAYSGTWTNGELEIVGDWGFASVPADVEHWAIVQVAMWLRRDVSAFESTFSLDEDRLERPSALASAVRAGLSDFRRHP